MTCLRIGSDLRHAAESECSRSRRIGARALFGALVVLLAGPAATQAQGLIQLQPSNCYAGVNLPQMFVCWRGQDETHWMGVAVNPSDDTQDVYIEVFPDASGVGSPIYGSYVQDEANFVVSNFSPPADTLVYTKTRGEYPQSNQYVIEWDPGQGPLPFGTPLTHNYGGLYHDCGLIHVWDVPLESGATYRFWLTRTGEGDIRMALLDWHGATGWRSRGDALWEDQATDPQVNDPYEFVCTETGTYALVVWQNLWSWQDGDFTVQAQVWSAGGGEPDLVINRIEPDTALEGQNVTADIYVQNTGDVDAGSSYTSLSIDGAMQCAQIYTPLVTAGGTVMVQCNLGTLAPAIYDLEACADVTYLVSEEYENNNCRTEPLDVQAVSSDPDLIIIAVGPQSVWVGQNIEIWAIVRNRGSSNAGASFTEFQIDGGIACAQVATPPIQLHQQETVYCQVGSLPLGEHTLRAEADITDVINEQYESNNVRSGTIWVNGPDLVVDRITPEQIPGGVPWPVVVRVRNIGNQFAHFTFTGVSVDGSPTCPEIPTIPLWPEQHVDIPCTIGPLSFGMHEVEATADITGILDEGDESNNSLVVYVEALVPGIVFVRPDGTGDFPTIQEAIDGVPPGGTIVLTEGIFSGPGNRDLNFYGKELTIESEDPLHPELFIIDCGGSAADPHRGFIFESGEDNDCVVSGFTIRHGYVEGDHGGGIVCIESGPTIRNVILTDNVAGGGGFGGAISCIAAFPGPPRAHLENVTIAHNDAHEGGALSYSNDVTLENTLITHNGGRHCAVFGCGPADAILTCCNIWGNSFNWVLGIADQYGINGNISLDPRYCDEPNRDYGLHLDSPCRPENNLECGLIGATDATCGHSGGHIYYVRADGTGDFPHIQAAIDASVSGDIILLEPGTFTGSGNRDLDFWGRLITIAGSGGDPAECVLDVGGSAADPHRAFTFHMAEGPLTVIQGITIRGGHRTSGGAIGFGQGCSPTIENCVFVDNVAEQFGGAVYSNESSPKFIGCVFESNDSWLSGGAAMATSSSAPEFWSCTFYLNTAGAYGGAISGVDGSILCNDCTLHANAAGISGGALRADEGAAVSFVGNTLVHNGAPFGCGMMLSSSAAATVDNTIIAFGSQSNAVGCTAGGSATLTCCDVYGNAGGDWVGCIDGQLGQDGNISADPLFCDAPGGDFALHSDSPCAEAYNPACGQIGAHDTDCGQSGAITCLVRPDGSGDYPTIQAAIDDVADGSLIELADGLYQGVGNRDIQFRGKAITVRAQSQNPEMVIINCGGSETEPHRAFVFDSGEGPQSILEAVTITGGYQTYSPGILISGSSPEIRYCIIIGNQGYNSGGMSITSGSNPVVRDCIFIGNTVTNAGGACVIQSSQVDLRRCQFIDNHATWGGGALYFNNGSGEVFACTFSGNSCEHMGAAMHCQNAQSTPLLERCTFYGNDAPQGGAIYCRNDGDPVLENCILSFSTQGAAVYCTSGGAAYLSCCDVYGNAGGDYVGCIAGQQGVDGNFSEDPLYCDAPGGDYTIAVESPCSATQQPYCGPIGAWGVACSFPLQGVEEEPAAFVWSGEDAIFWGAAPNPCRGRTVIRFALPEPGPARVLIHDLNGRLVRTLFSGEAARGMASLAWDGRDECGRPLATGVYCMRLAAGGRQLTRTVILYR